MSRLELYKAIFDSAPDAMIVVDAKGVIFMANQKVKQLFGYDKQELIGKTVECLLPDRYLASHINHRKTYSQHPRIREMGEGRELIAKRKNAKEFFVEISLSPLKIGKQSYTSAAIRDVSQKIQITRQLRRSLKTIESKNTELEQFPYIASHDLQEPLRTITCMIEILASDYGNKIDDNGKKIMRYILEASVRMRELIKGLLDYSRLGQQSELTEVDCNRLMQSLRQDLKFVVEESHSILLIEELPTILANEAGILHLFQNLLSNAIKFRKPDIPPEIRISADREKHFWKFSIQDNGIGIDPAYHEKIFLIFQRLHPRETYPGTGIGLAHCKKIVDLHGGKIWLDSQPGRGTTFYFTIPI